MRKAGLEPARPNSHKNLNLACLPIPTLPRTVDNLSEIHLLVNKIFIIFFSCAALFTESALILYFSDERFYVRRIFYYLQLPENDDHHAGNSEYDDRKCGTFYAESDIVEE